jgi:hypothetical protein
MVELAALMALHVGEFRVAPCISLAFKRVNVLN